MKATNKELMKAWIGGGILGAAAMILTCTAAEAAPATPPPTLDINLISYHMNQDFKYNELNPGLGATYYFSHHFGVTGGFYENSFSKNSNYLAGILTHRMKQWSFGLRVGVVTGYDNVETTPDGTSTIQRQRRAHHESRSRRYDSRYKTSATTTHSHPVNKNKYTFLATGLLSWHITKHIGTTLSFTHEFAALQANISF
jgi:hypothetical protein